MPVVNAYPALKPGRYEIDGIFQPDRLALGFGKEQSGVFGEKIREPGPVLCIDITEIARLQCLYFQYGCYIFRIDRPSHLALPSCKRTQPRLEAQLVCKCFQGSARIVDGFDVRQGDRKSTRLNSSH